MLLSSASASLPAVSTASSDSGFDTTTFSEQVLKNSLLLQVSNALDIDPGLTYHTDPSLRIWYKKYNAYNEAVAKLTQIKATSTWTLADIGHTELINIFGGQLYWHSHISSAFGNIQNHKLMVKWLEREDDDDEPSDLEIWHL